VLLVEGSPHLWPADALALGALVFASLAGSAFAYLLWFEVLKRVPAMTASLGVLSVPVIGIVASILVLEERLTMADVIGSALTLAAASCVLLAPGSRRSKQEP